MSSPARGHRTNPPNLTYRWEGDDKHFPDIEDLAGRLRFGVEVTGTEPGMFATLACLRFEADAASVGLAGHLPVLRVRNGVVEAEWPILARGKLT